MPETFDTHELREFAADLRSYPVKLARHAERVVERGALNIKNAMREDMARSQSFGPLARSITYDIIDDGSEDAIIAEIGPVKRYRGGASTFGKGANIAYFGGANGGGGTVPDPRHTLEAEAPRTQAALADRLDEVHRG